MHTCRPACFAAASDAQLSWLLRRPLRPDCSDGLRCATAGDASPAAPFRPLRTSSSSLVPASSSCFSSCSKHGRG